MVTFINKTIGPTGRDYASFALAEAATSTIGTSADLVANDEAIVFSVDPVTFTTGASLAIANTALTVDATRNVSYTAASGQPIYEYTGGGNGIRIFDPYTRWSGIDMVASSGTCFQIRANSGYGSAQAGTVLENATLTASNVAVKCQKFSSGQGLGTSSEPITLRNVVTKSVVAVNQFVSGSGHTTGAHLLVVNCTHLGSGSTTGTVWQWALTGGMPSASAKLINCLTQATMRTSRVVGSLYRARRITSATRQPQPRHVDLRTSTAGSDHSSPRALQQAPVLETLRYSTAAQVSF